MPIGKAPEAFVLLDQRGVSLALMSSPCWPTERPIVQNIIASLQRFKMLKVPRFVTILISFFVFNREHAPNVKVHFTLVPGAIRENLFQKNIL